MKRSITARISFALVLIAGGLLPSLAQAQSGLIARVLVRSETPPLQATGLIINQAGTFQHSKVDVEDLGQGNYAVSFPYRGADVSGETVATALVVSEDGSAHYGNTVPLTKKPRALTNPLIELPRCAEPEDPNRAVQGQFALVESLVEIRQKRRTYSLDRVRTLLDEAMLVKLRKLENAFGLAQGEPLLSPELHPMDLNFRLSRLLHTVEAFKVQKRARANPSDS